jgi:ubiquinone/menaquinone biosynthesis C-methylase UbiE
MTGAVGTISCLRGAADGPGQATEQVGAGWEVRMSFDVDPDQNEIRALKAAALWTDRDVLEFGCGEGRLARRVTGLGASVAAIDPNAELMRAAAVKALESPDQRTRYVVADGRRLPFWDESFDIVIFGWSL